LFAAGNALCLDRDAFEQIPNVTFCGFFIHVVGRMIEHACGNIECCATAFTLEDVLRSSIGF